MKMATPYLSSSSSPSPFRLLISQCKWSLAPALLGAACYLNSLSGDLVHDDVFAIRENEDIRPSTPLSNLLLNDFWGEPLNSTTSHKSYRPLTVLSFRLNFALHGLEPWGYHVTNVVLHVLVTVVLGWFCRVEVFSRLDAPGLRDGVGDVGWSGAVMLLFASHPVHTEAVSGVVGRADLLACLLFLLSLIFYCSSTSSRAWPPMLCKLLVSMVAAGAAMICKEHGATVLGVCLAYDLLIANRTTLYRIWRGSFKWSNHANLMVRVLVVMTTTCVLLGVRVWLLHGHLPHFSAQDNPASFAESFLTRTLTYGYLAFFNCKLLFFPSVLSYDWQMGSISLLQSLADPRNILTLFLLLTCAALLYSALWGARTHSQAQYEVRDPAPLIGFLLLMIPYLPASNLLVHVGFVVAERILYIPRSALGTVPGNAKVHFNYANYLRDSGLDEESVEFYHTAISLAPDHSVSHNNLGSLLTGREAELHFREAVHHNPLHYKAFFNLGNNLQQQNRLAEAEAAYRESLKVRPTYVECLMSLASVLVEGGHDGEAEGAMRRALELAPLNADVHNNVGGFLLRQGRLPESLSAYQEAIRLAPHHTTALTGLARVQRGLGQNVVAEETFRRSLALSPEPSTYLYLASMLFNMGRTQDSIEAFTLGLTFDPNRTDLTCGLGQALVQVNLVHKAMKVLEDGLAVTSREPCLHRVMGVVYLQQGHLEQAVDHLRQAVELSHQPDEQANALHLMGGALKDLGQLNEAEEAYRHALSLAPDRTHTRTNLGAVLHLKKDYEGARVEYEAALLSNPQDQILRDNLSKLERVAAARRSTTRAKKDGRSFR